MRNAMGLLIFAAGAALGSVTTWYLVKEKYAQIAQEEIDSVKEVFSERGRKERVEKATDKIEKDQTKRVEKEMGMREYAAKLSEERYSTDYADIQPDVEKPYVISPDEFSELDDYTTISLTFYSDHILADDDDELIDDIEATVGVESLNHFGEYEDDSVFVRNDRLKCDYEILLDQRKYSDVIKKKPYLRRADDVENEDE